MSSRTLPFTAREIPDTSIPARSRPLPPQRILVVDNNASLRRRYANALLQAGYRVDVTEDDGAGWNGLRAARHDPDAYQLLITNNEMPRLSGRNKRIQQPAIKRTLLIIPASGAVSVDTKRLRLVAILPKPAGSRELVQRVRAVLHHDAGLRQGPG